MAKESQQDVVGRNRPPRVQIHYKVQVGNAMKMVELPFVVGVLGDLRGDAAPSEELRDRHFKEIDKSNFDDVLASYAPSLNMRVKNKLAEEDDGSELGVELKFKSLDDFNPDRVAEQFEPTKQLLDMRNKLADLVNRIGTKPKLEKLLEEVLDNTQKVQALAKELGLPSADGATEENA